MSLTRTYQRATDDTIARRRRRAGKPRQLSLLVERHFIKQGAMRFAVMAMAAFAPRHLHNAANSVVRSLAT